MDQWQTIPNQPTPTPVMPEGNLEPEKKSGAWIVAIVLVAILFLVVGIGAGYFLAVNFSKGSDGKDEIDASTQESEGQATTSATSSPDLENKQEISWVGIEEIPSLKISTLEGQPGISDRVGKTYLIGKMLSGKYQGSDLVLMTAYPDGPAIYPGYFRFVRQGNQLILLEKNSSASWADYSFDKNKFSVDVETSIDSIVPPETISGPKGEILSRDKYATEIFSLENLKLVFSDNKYGNVYTTSVSRENSVSLFDRGGFYLRLPDGTTAVYEIKSGMMDETVAPKITWSDGKINSQTYSHVDSSGCGARNYASVVNLDSSQLKAIGKTASGEDVWAPSDSNNYYYKNIYDTKYQVEQGKKKISYAEFIATRPLFFWRDSFGRLIKFESTKYQPLAECGKPVIYLYPTETTKVSVKVEPQRGFSYTDPPYNNGWEVMADPDGKLTEVSSGKNYPYLFWEGKGGIYATPEMGWTVRRADVKKFLTSKLQEYHFSQKEIADFLEFWLPRMQEKPYYFITFLGTSEMNRLAPLEITPKPDTVIRVLMDFTPLDNPIPSKSYKISVPERKGFTVMEWGGVLR